ncbi:LLM class flavin-dependent oxidoreductase [Solirubrobacter soli]|uniref:LLM class flavin-dependent oxidoreductase n=1 Tax=Solirubrobacter soli TaxID=363832 RepID=UPI000400ECFB|nr:LLM class flavin-dependent oxidoreductase [Solirubrobacter soli]
MSVGVISHIHNPTLADVRSLAVEAEAAGADWLGVPDAFWWRDSWLLAAEAARATSALAVGPLVTNPYLRHPFHTTAAVATLQELAGDRVRLGLGAGGSELPASTGIDRGDAAERIVELVALIRRVAGGAPLSETSRRGLEVPLTPPRVVVAGRAPSVLRAGAAVADDVLLWAVPRSELAWAAGLARRGDPRVAAGGDAAGAPGGDLRAAAGAAGAGEPRVAASGGAAAPRVIWAPLLVNGDATPHAAAYAALNSRPATRRAWGLDEGRVDEIRRGLVAGEAVERLVPEAVLRDVIVRADAAAEAAALARGIGADAIAVPAHSVAEVAPRVAWARAVLAQSREAVAA